MGVVSQVVRAAMAETGYVFLVEAGWSRRCIESTSESHDSHKTDQTYKVRVDFRYIPQLEVHGSWLDSPNT